MAQKRDVIQCIFILKHLFRFENECAHAFEGHLKVVMSTDD